MTDVTDDRTAAPGEAVKLTATVDDPDGRGFDARWDVALAPTIYSGTQDLGTWSGHGLDATFTVPVDTHPGDRFVLTLTIRTRAERPTTRYAQLALTVA